MTDEKKAVSAWIEREERFLLRIKHYIKEAAQSVKEADYDTIDVIIDLLASTLVAETEDFLSDEYRQSFQEGVDLEEMEPDETAVAGSVYAEVGGMSFDDRLYNYVNTAAPLSPSLVEILETEISRLLATDGHRVRMDARQQAGDFLEAVGFTVEKTWISRLDERVRDTHTRLHGTTLPIDGYFHTVNGSGQGPGLFGIAEEDVNCRCSLAIRKVIE